ncbi:hypothetical protein HPB50_000811 [Hyalomma asiaticum]|uniref:Uncharacterized protein n=1 Tax=Hyalomma asiaticum TaxID=266040 RepID=A0ACB7SLY7_HYAAI|nr:hypothetical protein HPB50_000811 [Hyalomma asiaticum]
MSEHRRGSKDLRGGSRKQSHALENEAGNGMFEKEQRVEGSLRTACDQAREEMHGMSMPGSLLCHRELANERQCREPVVRETRRGEVLASLHALEPLADQHTWISEDLCLKDCGGHRSGPAAFHVLAIATDADAEPLILTTIDMRNDVPGGVIYRLKDGSCHNSQGEPCSASEALNAKNSTR